MHTHTHNPYEIFTQTTLKGASFSTNQKLINTPKHSDNMDRLAQRTRAAAAFKQIKCEAIPAAINTRKQLHNHMRKAVKALQADHAANSFSIMATTEHNSKSIPRINNNIRKAIKPLQIDHAGINKSKQLHNNIPKAIKALQADHAANSFSIVATTEYNLLVPQRSMLLSSGFLKLSERGSKPEKKPQSMPIYYKSVVSLSNPKMYI